jgi:hypothetical protein
MAVYCRDPEMSAGKLWDWRKSTGENPGREPKNRNFTTILARELGNRT